MGTTHRHLRRGSGLPDRRRRHRVAAAVDNNDLANIDVNTCRPQGTLVLAVATSYPRANVYVLPIAYAHIPQGIF